MSKQSPELFSIGTEGLRLLERDKDNNLYYDGVRLRTELELTDRQKTVGLVAAGATVLAALSSVLASYVALSDDASVEASRAITIENLSDLGRDLSWECRFEHEAGLPRAHHNFVCQTRDSGRN